MSRPDPADPFAEARGAVADGWRAGGHGTSSALAGLVADVLRSAGTPDRVRATWLLLTALTGSLPSVEELEDAVATLDTAGIARLVGDAVGRSAEPMRALPAQRLGGTLVDVSSTARTNGRAGVPRVVRQLVVAWGEPAGVHYVVWEAGGLRTLDATERATLGLPPTTSPPPGTRVVPWDARFVVVEVLRPEPHAVAVEAMAAAGAAEVRGIVYDLSALVEPDPDATRGPFLHHLAALSRGARVSGISHAVTADLADYFSIFARNGRPTPVVTAHVLPLVDDGDGPLPELDSRLRGDRSWPLVLAVSSIYRRKNHARLLAACERLWAEGVRFRLLVVEGTQSRVPTVGAALDRLVEHGRPATLLSHLPEPDLKAAYRLAHVSAYVSLAEGYGLPIAESLAAGTPVVASGHGSMAELGAAGGVLFVDPRDVASIADGLRRVLTDPAAHAQLAVEAVARRRSSWEGYARSVGEFLGVLDAPGQQLPDHDAMSRSAR